MRTLRELIPELEVNWLLPVWLLLTIVVAAIAEVWTIGTAVQQVYGLQTGWAIGGVVASAQAIGSMLWARATQHNAARIIRTKTAAWPDWMKVASQVLRFDLPTSTRRIQDRVKSEPGLNVIGPALVSIIAGSASVWIGVALYSIDGLNGLDIALAVASPAGSVAAAALNGLFAYGEAALADWRNATGRHTKPPKTPKTTQPVRKLDLYPTPKPATTATAASSSTSSHTLAMHLISIKQRLDREFQENGRSRVFTRADVERWLNISESHARNILAYGKEAGLVKTLPRYRYQFMNTTRQEEAGI